MVRMSTRLTSKFTYDNTLIINYNTSLTAICCSYQTPITSSQQSLQNRFNAPRARIRDPLLLQPIAFHIRAPPSLSFDVLRPFRGGGGGPDSRARVAACVLSKGFDERCERVDEGARGRAGAGVRVKLGQRGCECGAPRLGCYCGISACGLNLESLSEGRKEYPRSKPRDVRARAELKRP